MNAMIEGYRQAGWQVYLLSMNTSRHYVKQEQLSRLFTDLYAFEAVPFDNKLSLKSVVKNFLFSNQPEHVKRFYSHEFKEKIKKVLTSFEPDVVQIESVFLTSYLPAIKKYSSAVTVLRMHNVEYQIWQGLARRTRNVLKKMYLNSLTVRVRNYERAAWKSYDLLLPITEKDASMVQRLEEVDNILVAPFGIDTDRMPANRNNERWVGYHIGAMDWMPNRDGMEWFLTKAWPEIHKTAPKFEFYYAGRNMPPEFKKIKGAGLHCMDEVPDANVFIGDKKILIVPITSGGGIRVKILESMAAGKVIVTTSTGIKGIEAKPGEHYLKVKSPQDYANAIKWCLENKTDAEKMARNAQKLIAEKYEQRKVMKRITDAVERIVAVQA